jgi:hypothetical protein
MSKDPLGFDPIQHIRMIQQSKLLRGIDAYRHNILLRGMYVADRDRLVSPGVPLDDQGNPLTDESRAKLSSQRAPYDPESFGKKERVNSYDQDLQDREVEAVGESSEKVLEAQPEMTVVFPKELLIADLAVKETPDATPPIV